MVFKIRAGLWALNSSKEEVLTTLDILPSSPKDRVEIFNHSYYQGLLVERGNLKKLATFVPNQDKNKLFLNRPLKELRSLDSIPSFSHEGIVNRASTVDVIWFNDRAMPHSFFEVENTSDIQNSLLKFYDLSDFYTNFYIVADEVKRREFNSKLSYSAFKEIKPRIKFMNYDRLATLYDLDLKYSQYNI